MRFDVVSLFPEMFKALDFGITNRAQKAGLLEIQTWNPRDFTLDKHRTVDDRPYGGGPGMLMKVQPLQDAITAAREAVAKPAKVIYLSPQGKTLRQQEVIELSKEKRFILVSGRYEGIDQRLIDKEVDACWSIGDYVLSGGELPSMVFIDALTRLIPGSLGHAASADADTFSDGLLEYPQFTRPEELSGAKVPEVLLSGNHQAIKTWRLKQSLGRTWQQRPDLLDNKSLSVKEKNLLTEFIEEFGVNHE